ncbi:hypothetical protein DR64_5941 [Paraburkholderia xenovorans LB400]|nr:hypothetical protein DR64_5941 [Paraburkholderia xenovorans LB400]
MAWGAQGSTRLEMLSNNRDPRAPCEFFALLLSSQATDRRFCMTIEAAGNIHAA